MHRITTRRLSVVLSLSALAIGPVVACSSSSSEDTAPGSTSTSPSPTTMPSTGGNN